MKEFTQDDIERISGIVTADNSEAARAELADLHPADIAELFQQLDTEQSEYLFKLLDEDTAADVLMELDEDERLKLIEDMPAEEIAKQIDHLDTDDAVDLIQQLDEEERDEIISHIDDVEQAGDIIDLLKYDEDTAGRPDGHRDDCGQRKLVDARVYQADAPAGRRHGRNLLCLRCRQRLPPARHAAAEDDAHTPLGIENQARHGGRPREREGRHPH